MSAAITQPNPTPASGPQAEDDQFYREILHGLINVGAELISHLPQQAATPAQTPQQDPAPQPVPPPSPDVIVPLAIAYDRITRAIRRSIALARSFNDPTHPPKHPPHHRAEARKRILRAVEDTIQRQDYDDGYAECDPTDVLTAELRERMDAPDLDDDIANRPTDDIIKDILRDLGLAALPGTRPWKRRTPADIDQLSAEAATPSRARQPGAALQPPAPQPERQAQPSPTAIPGPNGPPAIPRTSPARPGKTLPDDPAEAIAVVLRHHAQVQDRWRPPPGA